MFDYHNYFIKRFYTSSNEVDDASYPESSRFSPLDVESVTQMFPLGDDGNVVDLLTRLLRSDSALERNQLMQLLQDNGSNSAFAKLDDDTKLSLLKPRSLQSLGEISEYSRVVASAIKQLSEAPATEAPATEVPATEAPATEAPAT